METIGENIVVLLDNVRNGIAINEQNLSELIDKVENIRKRLAESIDYEGYSAISSPIQTSDSIESSLDDDDATENESKDDQKLEGEKNKQL